MNTNNKLQQLEKKLIMLQYEVNIIKSLLSHNPSEYAQNILKIATDKGLNPSPYGESLDMIRLLDLLNKLGVLK